MTLALLAYLLGSFPSGVIFARLFNRVDVRAVGSGHTGMLNTYRAAGFVPAVLTLLADGLKGLLAVLIAGQWPGGWAVPLAATLAVIGHCYPVWTGLRGGMGLATSGGVILWLQPAALVVLIVGWFPLKRLMRDSTYASLAVAALLPLLLAALQTEPTTEAAGLGIAGVLIWRHAQALYQARHALRSVE